MPPPGLVPQLLTRFGAKPACRQTGSSSRKYCRTRLALGLAKLDRLRTLRRSIPRSAYKTKVAQCDALSSFVLCPREESNLDLKLRRLLFYPLNYRGFFVLPKYPNWIYDLRLWQLEHLISHLFISATTDSHE